MTPIYTEISAAPHLPPALRVETETNVLSAFMGFVSGAAEMEVIEENGELFLVSYPVTSV